jgi:preprotein translocase subunit SecA
MRLLLEYDDYLYELHKIRLRPTQKMAILYVVENEKNVLEQVNTGEGKSYIIAAIAIIRRKIGYKHVDIITSSPVLAQRDVDEMRSLYVKFHVTVGHNCDEDLEQRKKAYESDVVYGDIARFQRDYLLHTFYKKNVLGARTRDAVVVDEVDNMLLDNGNNMLYLSHNVVGLNLLDSLLVFIHKQIYLPIFNGVKTDLESMQAQFDDGKIKQAVMTDIYGQITLEALMKLKSNQMTKKHVDEAFNKLIQNKFIDTDGYLMITNPNQLSTLDTHFGSDKVFLIRLKNTLQIILGRQRAIDIPKCLRDFVKLHLDEFIKNSKNAMFMKSDHEYVVDVDHTRVSSLIEPRITIIDSNTGADLATSQWSEGLHQFLQIKHGCRLSPVSLKAVFVSNVAYLKVSQSSLDLHIYRKINCRDIKRSTVLVELSVQHMKVKHWSISTMRI